VRLETLTRDHVPDLWAVAQHDEIWRYMPVHPRSYDSMSRMVAGIIAETAHGQVIPFATRNLATGQIVGSTQILDIQPAHRGAEIGFTWLTPAAWRTAINTECKLLLLTYCFESMNLIRVQLKTDARNNRSQRAIERLGAVREGVLRKHRILHDGYIRDSVYYSIVDNEWPHVKLKLADLLAGVS